MGDVKHEDTIQVCLKPMQQVKKHFENRSGCTHWSGVTGNGLVTRDSLTLKHWKLYFICTSLIDNTGLFSDSPKILCQYICLIANI